MHMSVRWLVLLMGVPSRSHALTLLFSQSCEAALVQASLEEAQCCKRRRVILDLAQSGSSVLGKN